MSGIVRNFIASVVHKIQGTLPCGIYGLWTPVFKHQSGDVLTDYINKLRKLNNKMHTSKRQNATKKISFCMVLSDFRKNLKLSVIV